jgi:hypothetical protein
MKRKDIMLIIVVAFISGVVSLIISNWLISSPKNRQQKVEVVEALSSNFPTPDSQYFNKDSVDPTKPIQIGGNPNPTPFDTKKQ